MALTGGQESFCSLKTIAGGGCALAEGCQGRKDEGSLGGIGLQQGQAETCQKVDAAIGEAGAKQGKKVLMPAQPPQRLRRKAPAARPLRQGRCRAGIRR